MNFLKGPLGAALAVATLLPACSDPDLEKILSAAPPPGGWVDPYSVPVNGSLDKVDPSLDTDGDGVNDVDEGSADTDGDGTPAHLDPDETPVNVPPPSMSDGGVQPPTPPSNEPDGCGVVSAEAEFERSPVDVIWVIDNSGSMTDDFFSVAAGLASFTQSVAGSGADIHVVMVSGFVIFLDPAVQADTETYNLRLVNVQSTDSFRVLLNDFPNYANFLRPEAATHIIVVTDDASDTSKDVFRDAMRSNLGGKDFYFHALTAAPAFPLAPFPAAYNDLAAETGGQQQAIGGDWTTIFDELQSAIVQTASLPCDVPVPDAQGRDLNNVQVLYAAPGASESPFPKAETADQCGNAVAWHYDNNEAPAQIILCPAACDAVKAGGNLDVVFACEPPPPLL